MANKKRSLGGFSREAPSLAEHVQTLTELDTLHDRSAAIICAADLETRLENTIASKLVHLTKDEYNAIFVLDGAPLANFSGKIRLAHALGIIGPQTKADLEEIKTVRNAFAHARRPIRFDTPQIAARCKAIQFLSVVSRPDGPGLPPEDPWPPIEPRKIYCEAASFIGVSLMIYADEGRASRPPQGDDFAMLIAR